MITTEKGFVNIQTLFNEKTERSVAALQELYDDDQLLLSLVQSLSAGVLEEKNISGKKVLLKPNWVKHSYNENDDICLRTHDRFLMAVLKLVLSKKPASVVIGDAPIQGCVWNKMLPQTFYDEVASIAATHNIPVIIKDFRRVVFDTLGNKVDVEKNPMSEYLIFDLGKKSYLEPITSPDKNKFRVSQYNPDKFMATHKPGMHKYCITKEMFSADVVISLPKVKTHQKAGITAALKNIVGLNGDKDFLPHHRIGGTKMGGDSYPGRNWLRYWSELALDNSNRNKGNYKYWFWLRLSSLLWKLSLPGQHHRLSAAWYGNDTTWRMVMDLNMIVLYGRPDGTISDTPQRLLYSFCDGIVGGQGDGPLYPDPLNLGVASFSNDSAMTDICMSLVMGLSNDKIPLLKAASSFDPFGKVEIKLNGVPVRKEDLQKLATVTTPPPGWV
jgi:uncharacterized protein (DUF362 family)